MIRKLIALGVASLAISIASYALPPVDRASLNDLEKGKFLLDATRGYVVKTDDVDVLTSIDAVHNAITLGTNTVTAAVQSGADQTTTAIAANTATLSNLNQKVTNDFGTSTAAIRVAAQAGDGNGNKITSTLDGALRGLDTTLVNSGLVTSSGNTWSTTLGSGVSVTGTGENISRYPEITINLSGAPSVAPGTLTFEFSPDGVNWDVSVPTVLAGPNSFVPLPLRSVLPYFRVKYTNGATPLTQFRLTTVYHWQTGGDLTRVLNQTIDENEPVKNVRSFQGGKSPDGPYVNLPATGEVSSQSSMTPLGATATFTGASFVDMSGYVAAAVTVNSDVTGAPNGVIFNWYADSAGTTLVKTSSFSYGTAGSGVTFQVPRAGPYLRMNYINGGAAQSTFSFLTRLFVTAPPSDVLSISEVITGNSAAQIVKANVVGQQENGTYANVALSNLGSLKVAVADRPSQVLNRTRVIIPINRTALTTTPTNIYTVTSGKTLYISNFLLAAINDSTAIGEYRLRDNTTVRSTQLITSRSTGSPAAAASIFPTLPEPLPFLTNVTLVSVTGVIEVAGFLLGYEETN